MIEDFTDLATLKAMKSTFRDYDREWEFIKAMDCLCELKMPYAVTVFDDDARMVGWNWILVFEAQNDNAIGVL